FFNPFGWWSWVAELQVTDLLRNSNQLLDQFPEPAILLHLLLRSLHGRPRGNNPCVGLATDRMGKRKGRAMPFRSPLGAVASRFSAPAEASHQRTGPHLTDLRDPFLQLVALEHEGINVRVVGHQSPDSIIHCQTGALNPIPAFDAELLNSDVVRPISGCR